VRARSTRRCSRARRREPRRNGNLTQPVTS
jgi:hypothetical protein